MIDPNQPVTAPTASCGEVCGQAPTPIMGYTNPDEEKRALVNEFKAHEKALGELFKKAKASGLVDARTLAVGKTQAQTAYMWLNRSVFQPEDFYE